MANLPFLLLVLWVGVTVSTVVDLQKRLAGGRDCDKEDRPYHVKLKPKRLGKPHCGGSLIKEQWVLTAAHCKTDKMYEVIFGQSSLKLPKKFESDAIFPHPTDDIMLLKLKKPITDVTPVALPVCKDANNNIIDEPKIGAVVEVAGFGFHKIDINRGPVPKQPRKLKCAEMHVDNCVTYGGSSSNSPLWPFQNRLCYKEPGVNTCPGDSGGGVIYNGKIYGVHVGSGSAQCQWDKPATSMRVCSYIQWIEDIIKNN